MTKKVAILLLIMSTSLHAAFWDSVKSIFNQKVKPQIPTIKVLVVHEVPSATISVNGQYNVFDPYKNERLSTRFAGKRSKVESLPSGLRWGEEYPAVYQIKIVPDSKETTVTVDGNTYHGNIYVYDIGGTVSIVNEVNIEKYLHHLLPSKLSRPMSEEGLAATAIAERTNAYYQANSAKNPYWHVRGTDVGYQGAENIVHDPHISDAIHATKFMVMSRTAAYEGSITPFAVNVVHGPTTGTERKQVISIDNVEKLAARGENAARILSKHFPDASIELSVMERPDTHEEQHVAPVRISDTRLPKVR